MVKIYAAPKPPPASQLTNANRVQRYMQKGQLERSDWIWLVIFVLIYATARPYLQRFFKWWMAPKELLEGEEEQRKFFAKKAKFSPAQIRSAKAEPELLKAGPEEDGAVTTGSKPTKEGKAVNRKVQFQVPANDSKENSNGEKEDVYTEPLLPESDAERLLEWDDIGARQSQRGDKSDIKAWLEKWDS